MKKPKKDQVKTKISWNTIVKLADTISEQVSNNYKSIKSVYGIPRGGLVVALLISHRLKIPIVEKQKINKHTLIVDDINDSGKTLYKFMKLNNLDNMTAVLFRRYNSMFKETLYGKLVKTDNWLIFPWEKE